MKFIFILLFSSIAILSCGQGKLGGCEDCELMMEGMPETMGWKTILSTAGEPGEPLILSGVIYQRDGKTPAPGIVLYVYHTNQNGKYVTASGQTHARRHGHLRGWMKTDKLGRYEFQTIRPGAYPNRKDPQHIHTIIKEPNGTFYWIDDFQFDDDPLLTDKAKSNQQKRGGSGILSARKNEKGIWVATRDIILRLNVPDVTKSN